MKCIKWVVGVITLFLVVGIATGCESNEKNTNVGNSNGIVAGKLVPSLIDLGNGKFEYRLKNQTENEKIFHFNTGEQYDFVLYQKEDKSNQLYYQKSKNTMSTQVMGLKRVKQGEELTYSFDLSKLSLPKGNYRLEAWLTSQEKEPYKVTTDYVVK